MSSNVSYTEEAAREEMDDARLTVMKCETEIQNIKGALRRLTGEGSESSAFESKGFLRVSALKFVKNGVEASNDEMPPLKLLLSSPIEELTLSKLADPLLDAADAVKIGSLVQFDGVETSAATLTVSVHDSETKAEIGTSANHDLSPLCEFDVISYMKQIEGCGSIPAKVTEIEVALVSEVLESTSPSNIIESAPFDNEDKDSTNEKVAVSEKEDEDDSDFVDAREVGDEVHSSDKVNLPEPSEPTFLIPVVTVRLKIEFHPSKKDQQEKLYEMLNVASKEKSQAIERLRKSAAVMTRIKSAAASSDEKESPAVKPGFLKKKLNSSEKKPAFFVRVYKRFLGPDSLTRALFPVVKTYVMFFGVVGLMHWKGDILALPAPL